MKISIIGCGWLGLPLAAELVKQGNTVKGTTTRVEKLSNLEQNGIHAFQLQLTPLANNDTIIDELLDCDLLVINIPPGRNEEVSFHLNQMKTLMAGLNESNSFYCIYVSSTGVYPNLNRVVGEEDVESSDQAEHKQIALAEDFLKTQLGKRLTIMRCGGLAGYDRNLARHFAGRVNVSEGNYPINHIHRDDIIGAFIHIVKNKLWGEVYNVVSPEHPTKREYYTEICRRSGFELPEFSDEVFPYKIISSQKLIESGYKFRYNNPYDFSFGG